MSAWQVSAASPENGIARCTQLNHIGETDKVAKWLFRPKRNSVAQNIRKIAVYCLSKSSAIHDKEKWIIKYNDGNLRLSLRNKVRELSGAIPKFSALKKLKYPDDVCYADCSSFAAFVAEVAIGQRINSDDIRTDNFVNLMGDKAFAESFTQYNFPDFENKYPNWAEGEGLKPGDIVITRPTPEKVPPGVKYPAGHAYIVVDTVGTEQSFQELYRKVLDN